MVCKPGPAIHSSQDCQSGKVELSWSVHRLLWHSAAWPNRGIQGADICRCMQIPEDLQSWHPGSVHHNSCQRRKECSAGFQQPCIWWVSTSGARCMVVRGQVEIFHAKTSAKHKHLHNGACSSPAFLSAHATSYPPVDTSRISPPAPMIPSMRQAWSRSGSKIFLALTQASQ